MPPTLAGGGGAVIDVVELIRVDVPAVVLAVTDVVVPVLDVGALVHMLKVHGRTVVVVDSVV